MSFATIALVFHQEVYYVTVPPKTSQFFLLNILTTTEMYLIASRCLSHVMQSNALLRCDLLTYFNRQKILTVL